MKAVLFGVGEFFENRKEKIYNIKNLDIIAFSDNSSKLWGCYIDGIKIIPPIEILGLQFDKIVITSVYTVQIVEQLLKLGINKEKIIFWGDYWSELVSGTLQTYYSVNNECQEEKILIILHELTYTGAPIAAIYAGVALQKKGYCVTLAAPEGDIRLIQEVVHSGITTVVCPAIPYIGQKEIEWIAQFDVVMVNVLGMIPCVLALSGIKPVVWWIHESVGKYSFLKDEYRDKTFKKKLSYVQICAVSALSEKFCDSYIENDVDIILHYGIPDKKRTLKAKRDTTKMIFAIIGRVCGIKGHDVFIEAVHKMREDRKAKSEFWIIGKNGNDEFSQSIGKQAATEPTIRFLGEKTREEMELLYSDIDVVVSASRIDSLPIVMTEAMMHGKICIVSDLTGTVDYIENGKNGFIVQHENSNELCQRMEWIIDNQDQLEKIGEGARKTYETYFTMDQFGTQLKKVLEKAKNKMKDV